MEVRRSYSKRPRSVQFEHLDLKFGKKKEQKLTPEQHTAAAKAHWLARMTMPVKHVVKPRLEDPPETLDSGLS